MEQVFRALNELVAEGVIENYAIGGAMGAVFYIEAVQTEDIDAFVFLPVSASGLVDLSPIYLALTRYGGVLDREFVRFGAWPLQVLPDAGPLEAEAIAEAVTTEYEGVPVRVFRPEYLCCVALKTGRAKDYLRVQMFLDEGKVDKEALKRLAERFDLSGRLARVESLRRDAEG